MVGSLRARNAASIPIDSVVFGSRAAQHGRSLRAVRGTNMMARIFKSRQGGRVGPQGLTLAPPPLRKKPDGARGGRRGVELVEFALVILPMLGFVFLVLDIGWAVFKRATLQFAVREGCRFAVTNAVMPGLKDSSGHASGMIDSVKWVVQQRALGFLGSRQTASDPGYALIHVRFYTPSGSFSEAPPPTGCTDTTTAAPNWGGNLVEVSVENYQHNSLVPLWHSASPLNFVVRSSDKMEGNPLTGVPPALTCP